MQNLYDWKSEPTKGSITWWQHFTTHFARLWFAPCCIRLCCYSHLNATRQFLFCSIRSWRNWCVWRLWLITKWKNQILFYRGFTFQYISRFVSGNLSIFAVAYLFLIRVTQAKIEKCEKQMPFVPHHLFAPFHQEVDFSNPMSDFAAKATAEKAKKSMNHGTFTFHE